MKTTQELQQALVALTKEPQTTDPAARLKRQQALTEALADRSIFLATLTAQLSQSISASDFVAFNLDALLEQNLSHDEQAEVAANLLKHAIGLKNLPATSALIRIYNNEGTVQCRTVSPWELITASIASGDKGIFDFVYSSLTEKKKIPFLAQLTYLCTVDGPHVYGATEHENIYHAILSEAAPENRRTIQDAVEGKLNEELQNPEIVQEDYHFAPQNISLAHKKTSIRAFFQKKIESYKWAMLDQAISQGEITHFINALKNIPDERGNTEREKRLRQMAFLGRIDLLRDYEAETQKLRAVISSAKPLEFKLASNRSCSGFFSMLAASVQSKHPETASFVLGFYLDNTAKLQAMIAPQQGIYYVGDHSAWDSEDEHPTEKYHVSALAIAAAQLDTAVITALLNGFDAQEKRAVLKKLLSYTPDYLDALCDYLSVPKYSAQAALQKKSFKKCLLTIYKASREGIAEDFFSSHFCFFQTPGKIKISAAEKIINDDEKSMTSEEHAASGKDLLGQIMHQFN